MKAVVVCCDRIPTRLLGCYGSEWVETPALDRLAAEGVVFESVYAESLRPGTVADAALEGLLRSPQRLTIRALSDRALRSAAVEADAAIPWEYVEADDNGSANDVPLDRVFSDPARRMPPASHPQFGVWVGRWKRQIARDERSTSDPDSCESLFAKAAEAWDEFEEGEHGLLWLDVALAEADWVPPPHWRERHREDADAAPSLLDPVPGRVGEVYSDADVERTAAGWADRIAYFDAILGAFLQSIEASRDDAPTVVFTAEQGEPLGEHGAVGPCGDSPYQERIHVPLLVRQPGGRRSARRRHLASHQEVAKVLGRSLAGGGVAAPAGRPASERWAHVVRHDAAAVVTWRWKFIEHGDGQQELYARPEDLGEVNDLSARLPGVVADLQATLRSFGGRDDPR